MLPEMNFVVVVLAALIPMIIGFIYYHPKVLGTVWMKHSGMTDEKMKSSNMLIIFGGSLVLSFLISMAVIQLVIHQTHLFSMFQSPDGLPLDGSEASLAIDEVMRLAGDNFRTFKHGALHGTLIGLFLIFPIMATNGMFERKPFKLSLINSFYWTISLALMGGVICQFV